MYKARCAAYVIELGLIKYPARKVEKWLIDWRNKKYNKGLNRSVFVRRGSRKMVEMAVMGLSPSHWHNTCEGMAHSA
jgi:hypothetical protein